MNNKFPFWKVGLLIAFCLVLIIFPQPAKAWVDPSFAYRKTITFKNSWASAPIMNITIPINLDDSIIGNGKHRADWLDLRFVDSDDTTILNYWIENYTATTVVVKVRVPQIDNTNTDFIYVYYGNAIATNVTDRKNAWNQYYMVAYEMGEMSGNLIDSSRQGNTGTVINALHNISCKFGNCMYFDGSGDTVSFTATGIANNNITVCFWLKPSNIGVGWNYFLDAFTTTAGDKFTIFSHTTPYLRFRESGTTDVDWTQDMKNGQWYYICGAHQLAGTLRLYVNGTLRASGGTGQAVTVTGAGYIGSYFNTANWYRGIVDEFVMLNTTLNANEINATFSAGISTLFIYGSEEMGNIAPIITIFDPTNSTYFISNNFEFEFKAIDDFSTVYTLKAYIDDNLEYSNSSYNNDDVIIFYKNLAQSKTFNFTVWAKDTDEQSSSQTVLFTIKDYEISAIIYESNPYETENYNYSIIFRVNFDMLSNISSKLFWNSTNKGFQNWQFINSTHIEDRKQLTTPLIQINATSIDHYWDFNYTYKNGTEYNEQSSTNSQTLLFAYFLNSDAQTQNKNMMIEREDFINTLTVTAIKNYATLTTNSTYRSTTKTMAQSSYGVFTTSFDSGTVSNDYLNETYEVYSNLTVSFQGNSRTVGSESDNITAYKMILTNCSAGSISTTRALNFTLRDEENSTIISGTIEITNSITKTNELYKEYSFIFSNTNNASICIYPSWAEYTDDAMLQYKATSYTPRTYFISSKINNATQSVDMFLLSEGQSYSIVFFIRDENNNPYSDVIIKIQRYFTGSNTYKTVAQCKSDNPDGKCATFLKILDVYYRYILEKNLSVVKETTPSQIVCQPFESISFCPPYPLPIVISIREPSRYFKLIGNIAYSCSINEATNILKCTVSDTSQLMSKSQLIVEKKGALMFDTICNTTEESSAMTFTCDLGNRTGNVYRYQLLGYFSDPPMIIDQALLDYTTGLIVWGATGLLLGFLITSTLFFVGIYNPAVSLIFAFLGIVVGWMFGMIPVSISSLISLGLVVGIIVWKVRS